MRKSKGKRKVSDEPVLETAGDEGCYTVIDPSWYWNDQLSEGGRLKKEGLVLKTRLQDHGEERLNMNCRVETFGRVLGEFCERKRKIVGEMGMDRLFCLVDMCLPRNLCYWLATRVDVPNRKVIVPGGLEFNLSDVQVQWVLGLPDGPNRLPKKAEGFEMRAEIRRIWDKYHTVSAQGVKAITRRTLLEAVEGPIADGDEADFKVAFLMMALSDFMCPTTCHRFSPSMLPVVTVASEAAQYDFCSLVLDHLLHAVESFAKRFYVYGFANGCGGCIFFLAIYYLDRLKRPPVRWGAFPRISAWSTSEVNKAKNEDLCDSGDFGFIGCIDIAYGENHPLLPRDVRPGACEGVVRQAPNYLKIKGTGRKRRGRNSDLDPHDYVVMKAARVRLQAVVAGRKACGRSDGNVEEEEAVGEEEEEAVGEEEEGAVGEEEQEAVGEEVEEAQGVEEEEVVVEEEQEVVWEEQEVAGVGDKAVVGAVEEDLVGELGRCVENSPTFNSAINSSELEELIFNVVGENPVTDAVNPGSTNTPYVWSSLAEGKGKKCKQNNTESENVVENDKVIEGEGSVQSSTQYCNRSFCSGDEKCNSSNMPEVIVETPPVQANEYNVTDEDGTMERSRVQRKTKCSSRLSSAYVETWRKAGLWRFRKRLSLFVTIASGEIVSPEKELIRCCGYGATAEDCSTVMDKSRHLHPNFVRVAGVLYEKVWAQAFKTRSKRIMLDPEFGTEASSSEVGTVNDDAIGRALAHFEDVSRNKIDLIFIPVLHGSHWWCAAFSLKACEVAIIDPMDSARAADVHHMSIMKLKYAVDTLLNAKFRTWKLGRCEAFETFSVGMKNGGNVLKCGVQMLAAIKRSAWRLKFDVYMDSVEEEQSWLLVEDVLCSENENAGEVKELLEAHMNYYNSRC